jgi:hypothetical protein
MDGKLTNHRQVWESFIRGVELVIQPNGFPKEILVLKWRKEI